MPHDRETGENAGEVGVTQTPSGQVKEDQHKVKQEQATKDEVSEDKKS